MGKERERKNITFSDGCHATRRPQPREPGSSKRKDLEKEEVGGAGRRRWREQREAGL